MQRFDKTKFGTAKDHDYQTGKLLQMDSATCGMQERGSKPLWEKFLFEGKTR
jgi:hypothetical protein